MKRSGGALPRAAWAGQLVAWRTEGKGRGGHGTWRGPGRLALRNQPKGGRRDETVAPSRGLEGDWKAG